MDDPETAEGQVMRVLYQEHAAALWRYAVRLTGDTARAEDVVQETLLRAWRHPEVTDDKERSARAWLFTVARNLVIDERRSARFRSESGTPDIEQAADRAGPDEVETALDRMLLIEAMAQEEGITDPAQKGGRGAKTRGRKRKDLSMDELRDAMRRSLELAERLKIPCLILQAGADELCDPETTAEFSRRADGAGILFQRYEGLYHELFNEPQRARVIGDLCQWLNGTLKG